MTKLRNDNTTTFDVDGTLIHWINFNEFHNNTPYGRFELEYGNEICYFKPYYSHIRFLKHCKQRGDFIIVWSQNGVEWAEKVVKALNLEKYVDVVMAKPTRHVDDKEDVPSIVGNRIFIKE